MKHAEGNYYLQDDHHQGRWTTDILRDLAPLFEYQSYIHDVGFGFDPPEFDQHRFDFCPHMHDGGNPGSRHLVDAHLRTFLPHFAYTWDVDEKWLEAPRTKGVPIVCHLPVNRGERSRERWANILSGLPYIILTSRSEWESQAHRAFFDNHSLVRPDNFLDGADYVNSSKVFVGNVSCWNAIAEGLKVRRLVDVGSGAHNAIPMDPSGCQIQSFDDQFVRELIEEAIDA